MRAHWNLRHIPNYGRYPTRAEVHQANWSRLVALPGAGVQYDATDTPGVDSNGDGLSALQIGRLLDRLVVPQSILLKVRVVHLSYLLYFLCLHRSVLKLCSSRQVDGLHYGICITPFLQNLIQGQLVNGSVGQIIGFSTPLEAKRDNTDIGTEDGVNENNIEVLREIEEYKDVKWPVVQFTNKRVLLCVPADFTVNNPNGEVEARRRQVNTSIFI